MADSTSMYPNIKLAGLFRHQRRDNPGDSPNLSVPHFKGDINNARRKAWLESGAFQIPGEKELMLFYKIGSSVGDWTRMGSPVDR